MSLSPGARIGPYDVTAQIGVGGMGEVYRALDRKLQRDVAIKVLPEAFARDAERLARFAREARTLASLNHPNIAAIYGLEEAPAEAGHDVQALVMEMVEGPTLADMIAGSRLSALGSGQASDLPAHSPRPKAQSHALPLDEALSIAKQIAEALEAAHEKGVIHRDLKPANVKVRPDGVVKVLDFGLAKAMDSGLGTGDPRLAHVSQAPTITTPAMMTGAGMILGTAAYMAPEQARGKPVDKRADIWAFGCVLYEMLTGRRAFEGDEIADVMVAVLSKEPDWGALPQGTTAAVRTLLRRSLEKDPRRRVAEISTALFVMEEQVGLTLPQTVGSNASPAGAPRLRQLSWALAGALLASLAALAFAYRPQPVSEPSPVRFSVVPPDDVTMFNSVGQSFSLSPDGRRFVFAGNRGGVQSLWVRDLDSLEARPLAGTENASYPFWSPDSRTVGFFANGDLKTIDASGGSVRTLCEAPGASRGAAWSQEGVIVYSSAVLPGLFSVPAAGGEPVQVTSAATPGIHRFPSFLPDGRRFSFVVFPDNEVRLGSLQSTETTRLLDADSQVQIVPQGYLLVVRQGTLLAQPFDMERAMLTGEAIPLAEQLVVDPNAHAFFSAAGNGNLVYRTGVADPETQLSWFDRSGRVLGSAGPPGRYRNPLLSPNRTRVAVEMVPEAGTNRDIWLLELARGVLSRFTFDPRTDMIPVWSPDGGRIVFGSDREGGSFSLYQKASNGSAAEELLFKSTVENAVPYNWSPDGQFILHRYMNGGAFNTGVLPLAGDRKSRLYQSVPFNLTWPQVSPDGRWVAYQSNESGRYEVFVQTFPMPGGKWQVSRDGGFFPKWRGDGREIFYYAADGRLMAVPIMVGAAIGVGSAVPLFSQEMQNGPTTAVGFAAQYDLTPDGQRFLLNVPVEETRTLSSITVVLNWAAGLAGGR